MNLLSLINAWNHQGVGLNEDEQDGCDWKTDVKIKTFGICPIWVAPFLNEDGTYYQKTSICNKRPKNNRKKPAISSIKHNKILEDIHLHLTNFHFFLSNYIISDWLISQTLFSGYGHVKTLLFGEVMTNFFLSLMSPLGWVEVFLWVNNISWYFNHYLLIVFSFISYLAILHEDYLVCIFCVFFSMGHQDHCFVLQLLFDCLCDYLVSYVYIDCAQDIIKEIDIVLRIQWPC